MKTTTYSVTSVVNSLIETCKDGQEGFSSAAENVKNPDVQGLFRRLSAQRRQFGTELQRFVQSFGEKPETGGSFSGAVRRAWMDLKSAVTNGDEHAILAECERGEDAAVAEYRDALEHDELTPNVRAVIQQQFADVQAAHDQVRDLRDRFAK